MTRRRYTKVEKAEAVAAATLSNPVAAGEALGIPENTIRYWLDQPEFVALREKTREEVGERLWSAIQVGIDEVAKGLKGDAPLRDKATAVGILYDKHALLTGGATARSENRDISGTLSDGDIVTALRYAEDLTRTGSGRTAPPPPVETEG